MPPALPEESEKKSAFRIHFKRFWQHAVVAIATRLTGYVQRLPRVKAMRFGENIGKLAYTLAKRPRHYADQNLRLAYGDSLSPGERNQLIRRVFTHFGKMVVDCLRAPGMSEKEWDSLFSRVEGWEEYAYPALESGRGVICLTAHLGNWELFGRWLTRRGYSLTVVAREPEEAVFADYVRTLRESSGLSVANKGGSVKTLLSVLKRGESLAVLPDQNSGDLFVPFFGVPAGTVAGPALLARRTGAVLLPAYCLREPDDTYRIRILPPIPVDPTDDAEADQIRIMTQVNQVLEDAVREYPHEWLWLHNRWKSAFEAKNRARLPEGYDIDTAFARWSGS